MIYDLELTRFDVNILIVLLLLLLMIFLNNELKEINKLQR